MSSEQSFFRQAFRIWERTTSAYFDALVRNTAFLTASGSGLTGALTLKQAADGGMRTLIAALGLPTREDQERTLHLLQQIEGRIDDLQFQLSARPASHGAVPAGAVPASRP